MIPFTQFILPHGKKMNTEIQMPKEIEDKALQLIDAGYRFEIEILRMGQISMECINSEEDVLGNELSTNDHSVVENVELLVNKSHKRWLQKEESQNDE